MRPFLITLATFISTAAFAELPVITLTSIFPPGGQAGTEVEVTVTGAELDGANALFFSVPGITAKPTTPNHFAVTLGKDVPVGICDLRVAGKLGVTNPRAFSVSDRKEQIKAKPHDKLGSAVELTPGTIFNGALTASGSDYFMFTAKKGERVLVESTGSEIDSRLTPVIAVLDPAGKEIESARRGGLLDFTPPTDGQFIIELHDLAYGGGPEYPYRLKLTQGPRLDFIFPPAGQAGSKGKFTLYGRGLPGGKPADLVAIDRKPLEKLDVEIDIPAAPNTASNSTARPRAVTADGFFYRLKTPGGSSNPVFIGFATGSIVAETEPNNTPAQMQKLSLPCEVAGQFYPAADNDCFVFDAKKGDNYWVEVISNRAGVATSPFVLIQRDAADSKDVKDIKEIYATDSDPGGKRFVALSFDPAARFEVKEDGTYRLQVRDLFGGARSNPASTYRLSIRKESPNFRLAILAEPPPVKKDENAVAPRGMLIRASETIAFKVLAYRTDSFTGPIELSAENLPEGVKCIPSKIESGKNDGLLLLSADEKAATAVAAIHVIGTAKAGDTALRHQARGGTTVWTTANITNEPATSRLTSDFVLAVNGAEPAPITIQPAEDKVWEVPAGGKLDIPLNITRRGEFTEALKLKAAGTAAIEALKEIDVDAKTKTAKLSIDLKTVKIPAGTYTIYLSAQTKGKHAKKDVTMTLYSAPIRIVIQ